MNVQELTIVFKYNTFDIEFALKAIQAELAERRIASTGFALYGEPINFDAVWLRLKNSGRKTFNLVGHGLVFQLSVVSNYQLDFLSIKAAPEEFTLWDKWANRFIGNSNFVMSWLADTEYEFWQNAEDILQYTSRGKRHEHLPKKSNGLPPPLEQTIIDISGNPGRRLLRLGYYEVVDALMWLGDFFWELTGANKKNISHAQWLRILSPFPTVLRIEASAQCFNTSEGIDLEIQRKLRSLLFPRKAGLR
jgi:hypothetical protein